MSDLIGDPALLTERVTEVLRRSILSGEIEPGSHLSVPRISQELGVSRTPVREALFELARSGLVRQIPRRGAIVTPIGESDLRDLFDLREVLDGLAARLSATKMTPADVEDLWAILARHEGAVRDQSPDEHVAADLALHAKLREAAGNARLSMALEQLEDQVHLVIRAGSNKPRAIGPGVINEHRRIVEAVAAGDPERAEEAARAHVRSVHAFVKKPVAAGSGALS